MKWQVKTPQLHYIVQQSENCNFQLNAPVKTDFYVSPDSLSMFQIVHTFI